MARTVYDRPDGLKELLVVLQADGGADYLLRLYEKMNKSKIYRLLMQRDITLPHYVTFAQWLNILVEELPEHELHPILTAAQEEAPCH